MSSKKVHYERGTKEAKPNSRHHSKDSGVGSSSASDRASLGTSPAEEPPFNYRHIQEQRHNMTALQEALDAANDTIRQLQSDNSKLNSSLADKNRENRALKKERMDLLNHNDELMNDLDDKRKSKERSKTEPSPRTVTDPLALRTERGSLPPKREFADSRQLRRDDERTQGNRAEGRTTYMPTAPQGPPAQNPFIPIRARAPSVSYAPPSIIGAQTPVVCATAPIFIPTSPSSTSSRYPPNDGRYHLHPVE